MIYKLLVAKDEFALSLVVTQHLRDGFDLYGSPFAVEEKPSSNHPAIVLYGQAVVRSENGNNS
jgi:hypothetical protein